MNKNVRNISIFTFVVLACSWLGEPFWLVLTLLTLILPGDRCYESVALDPKGNLVEITV
ncbi:MAG: hypothetical protein LBE91_10045 [Tannerella sp.]|nr:hypothetical protein [Tannerella sp.]